MSIPYNPDVLKWARTHLNYTREDVAIKMKKDIAIIEGWENGTFSPTYTQLEKLAYEIYKKPLAIFFFPKAPQIDYINKSFRTIADYELQEIEPKFKLLIDKAYAYQLNIKELTQNKNISENQIIKDLQFDHEMSTFEMTEKLRSYLEIPLSEQRQWTSVELALKNWINKLEDLGIFVFKEAFKNNNYSGFCLYDDEIPVIYLNNSKSKSRQIFTLFHELAHLLFNVSGIDSKKHIDYYTGIEEIIEIHCNKFAGEFLIPDYDFEQKVSNLAINETNIDRLARYYCVSKEAILRKYLNFKLVSQEYYEEKREKWNKAFLEQKKKQNGGPKPHAKQNAYLSNNYKDIVISNYRKNNITYEQASSYLSINSKYFNQLIELHLNKGRL